MATVATVAFSFTLATSLAAPTLVGASARSYRAQPLGAVIKVETSKKFGKILVNASGRTLYFLTAETSTSLKCTGGCLGAWPPLLTKGKPQAGPASRP